MASNEHLQLLACPCCAGSLSSSGALASASVTCASCNVTWPNVGRVPWLYRDAEAKLVEWRNLYNVALADFRRTEDRLKAASRTDGLSELTKRRLQKELQARVEHRKAVETLLEPLGQTPVEALDLLRVLAGKAASTQVLTSYAVNAIRDWGWPDSTENERALALVRETLAATAPFANMAVLGAGAGRLAYDLHQAKVATTTVTLDINPFLTLTAERLASGKSLVLQEFPIAPNGLDNVAIARKLSAPRKADPGLTILFGDVLDAPLAAGAFDLVVTPWLIDILPEAPATFLRRVNRLLKPGGTWVNHGSCAFQQGSPERHLSREELLETVAACGFRVERSRLDSVPYLSSPASCQARHETVLTFVAVKVGEVTAPEPYRSLPPWLAAPTQALPCPESLAHLASTHAFHAEVLSLIDGRRSAMDVSAQLAQKYQLEAAALHPAVVSFLATMYEMAR